jgi:predicted MPP superfamily phosphohydrolase
MSPPQIGDSLIISITAVTQVALARLYFSRWRNLLSATTNRIIFPVLCALWAITGFDLIIQLFGLHLGRLLPPPVRGSLFAIGSAWGASAAASFVLFKIYSRCVRHLSPAFSAKRRTLIRGTGAAVMATPLAVAAFGGIVERNRFEVKEIDLPIPGLHPDLEGLRIAQISDLHVSPYLSVRQAARVVDMTNELRPQLTLVTGDLITEMGDPLDETIRELARLRADAGILGCLGNHEYYARCQNHTTLQSARYGITFLRSQARQLRWGQGVLNIAGVDYEGTKEKKEGYLQGAEELVIRDAPGVTNLLLSHNPDVFPVAVRKGYDAVLSGHTHGGQVTVEILNQTLNFARFVTPYVAGLYRVDGRSCYVNSGIGTIGMPIRIGAPPEISLFRLKRA